MPRPASSYRAGRREAAKAVKRDIPASGATARIGGRMSPVHPSMPTAGLTEPAPPQKPKVVADPFAADLARG